MSSRTLLSVSVLSQARGKAVPIANQPFLSCSYGNGCCIHSWLFPHKYITIWSPHFQHLASPPAETRHRAWFKCSGFRTSWEGTKRRAGETLLPFHKGISSTIVSLCIASRHHFYGILTKDWQESAKLCLALSCSFPQIIPGLPGLHGKAAGHQGSAEMIPPTHSIRKFGESWFSLLLTFFYQELIGKVLHTLWEVFPY